MGKLMKKKLGASSIRQGFAVRFVILSKTPKRNNIPPKMVK
jgi:hypothetical protein